MPSNNQKSEFLQVTLSKTFYVTAVATQGRYGGSEYVTTYHLKFMDGYRSELGFQYYKEDAGKASVFIGNHDSNTVKKNALAYPIYTKMVQFHPLAWYGGIALRVAVYGFDTALPNPLGCSSILLQGNVAETGGPGTVFISGEDNNIPSRVIHIDNHGRRPRVSTSSNFDKFKQTGAAAWVPLIPTALDQIALSGGSHVVLTGAGQHINVTKITDDGTSQLYLDSSIQLTDQLSACTKVFQNGEITIAGGSSKVSLERTIDVYGNINFVGVPDVYIGEHGGVLTINPGNSPSLIEVQNLIIKSSGGFHLMNYKTQSPDDCLWNINLKASGSKLSLEKSAGLIVDCSLNITGDYLAVESGAELKVSNDSFGSKLVFKRKLDIKGKMEVSGNTVSEVITRDVSVEGTFNTKKLSIGLGWSSLVVQNTAQFQIHPVGWFAFDHFEVNGIFRAMNLIKLKGFSQVNIPKIAVAQGGLLEIISNNPNFILCDRLNYNQSDLLKSETSQLKANEITIGGRWVSKKVSIPSGLNRFTIQESGQCEFEPVDWFAVDFVDVSGSLTTLNPIKMKGLNKPKISVLNIGTRGVLKIETKASALVCTGSGITSINDLVINGTAIIRAEKVNILGSFQISKMIIQPGWNNLNVQRSGSFQFDPVDWYSFDSVTVNGTFRSANAIKIKGLSIEKVKQIFIGRYGQVNLKTKAPDKILCDKKVFAVDELLPNGISLVQARNVIIAGSWISNRLSIEPGWTKLNVSRTGYFEFVPISWYSLDQLHVNGTFKSLRSIKMKGLANNRIASIRVASHGSITISRNPKLVSCNADKSKSFSEIIVNETSIVRADAVSIAGKFMLQRITNLPGWGSFSLLKSASFEADPVDWFMFNRMYIDGSFKLMNSVRMKGTSQKKISLITVGQYGTVNIQSQAPDQLVCDRLNFSSVGFIRTGISLVLSSEVNIAGTWLTNKLSIAPGWDKLNIQQTGKLEFQPIDWFSFDDLQVDGNFHAKDSIKMKGLINARISSLGVGSKGRIQIDTKSNSVSTCTGSGLPSVTDLIVNGISLVRANKVTIEGNFYVQKMTILPGWSNLAVHTSAVLQFEPVDWFSFNNIVVDGSFKSLNAIMMKGTSHPKIASISVTQNGILEILPKAPNQIICDRLNFSSFDFVQNGVSIARATQVSIAGKWLSKKLSITPGWNSLSVQQKGKFDFHPIDWFSFDSLNVDGSFHAIDSIKMKGLTNTRISRLDVGSNSRIQIDTNPNSAALCKGNGLPSTKDLVVNGISLVRADKVTIRGLGSLDVKKLSIVPGWGDLTVSRFGTFQFDPVDWFDFNNIVVDGSLKSLNSIKMKGTSQPKIISISIGQYGTLEFQSKVSGQGIYDCLDFTSFKCVYSGISLVRATQISIAGNWLSSKIAINPGWERLIIAQTGHIRIDPVNWYSFDHVNVAGRFRSLNSIRIKGCSQPKVIKISVETKGTLSIESKVPDKVICDRFNFSNILLIPNGISLIQAHQVNIAGTWLSKRLAIRPGWESLTIQETGRFDANPIDWHSFDNLVVNGKLTLLDSVKIKGVTSFKTKTINVGSKGIVNIITNANTASNCKSGSSLNASVIVNGVSIIKAERVAIAGTWTVEKLTVKPGWTSLSVTQTGRMEFDPHDWYNIDTIEVNGYFKALSEIKIKGLSKEKTLSVLVGSKGEISILSKKLTIILCDRVTVYGTVTIGYLTIGSGWQYLGVLGSSGKFFFNTDDPMPIISTHVSGLVKTTSPLGPANPITGDQFLIEQPGQVFINHQGPPMGHGLGTFNTTIFMNKIQIDGVFKAGSLYAKATTIIVGSSGLLDVNLGGHEGANGPGAGISSTSGASGASNGGRGGRGTASLARNRPYGDIFTIGKWGSGGGHGSNGAGGGRGGGMIQLNVSNSLIVNGQIQMNAQKGQSSNAGGGSGGSMWVDAKVFTGTGKIQSIGGNGNGNGGGGAGGRITVNYIQGGFHSDGTWCHGGLSSSENGGPGVVYLDGKVPSIRNIRVDNKGRSPSVSQSYGNYQLFISTGAVAYLNAPSKGFTYDFTHVEVYGAAHLVFPQDGTHVKISHYIYGDDSGYIHVAPTTTLNLTGTSPYKRFNVTWAPFIYNKGTLVFPNGTVEFRRAESLAYPSLTRSSHVQIWGTLIGDNAHMMVGYGGTVSFENSSPHNLRFVGITLQKTGRLIFRTTLNNESDQWFVEVTRDNGPLYRKGQITIENGGRIEARSLWIKSLSFTVEYGGILTLDGQGRISDKGPGAGDGSSYGTGAGYGGRGGRSTSTTKTGSTYGDYKLPQAFGSGGGRGGAGGGVLKIHTTEALIVEGVITASGSTNTGSTNTGGGSGGSIIVHTTNLEGSGTIRVNGGDAYGNGGGGGGGRMAIYWKDREWWFGNLQAIGGAASGKRNGGAGTVYMQDTQHGVLNRTLIFDNNNRPPYTMEISDLSQYNEDSGRSWLLPQGAEYELEEVHIIRGAHLALHPDIKWPHALKVYTFVGDRTGVLHVGPKQIAIGQFADLEKFEVNVFVHKNGRLHLPPTFSCYGIQLTTRGYLGLDHMTIARDCHLYLGLTGTTEQAKKEGIFKFNSLTVADGGEVTSGNDVGSNTLTFDVDELSIKGGGILHLKRVAIKAGNMTVDDLGTLKGDLHDPRCKTGSGKSATGSSGAGHGGNGGSGANQPRVGIAYGHVYEPAHFGCSGGGDGGGRGGGIINITVKGTMKIDGLVSADGENARKIYSGGGSGGSIWIKTNVIQGYGDVTVNGGHGFVDVSSGNNGGGGAGGRLAVYFQSNRTYSGSFQALGGNGTDRALSGGPGTMFFYHLIHKHRTLMISNRGRRPLPEAHKIESYSDVGLSPGRAWLLPSSGDHTMAGDQNYYFEEFQIYGGAHLAVLTDPHNRTATIFFRNMIGDRSGTIHIGYNQTMDLLRETIDLPFNVRVYRGGFLGLAPVTTVHSVTLFLQGVLSYVKNLTLHHGGLVHLYENSRTGNEHNENDFHFDFVTVQNQGVISMISDPATHRGMKLTTQLLHVEGGGQVIGSDLHILSKNISVNAEGILTMSAQGYNLGHGKGTGINGLTNKGLGAGSSHGSSGAGHGGTGGRGKSNPVIGIAYGNIYEPNEFGSSGGGTSGKPGAGGGRLFMNVTYLLEVDGVIAANGGNAAIQGGGGSGGSIWIVCNILKGYGKITANGGGSPADRKYGYHGGGGAGGRVAVYFRKNETFSQFRYQAFGGKAETGIANVESGGPGTVFLFHLLHSHRSLLIDNDGRGPLNIHMKYDQLNVEGGKAWIMPESGMHLFANHKSNFYFEELQIYGKGHLAIWPMSITNSSNISLYFEHMIGDRSGRIHIGDKQIMDLYRSEIDLPFSAHVYKGGHLGLAPSTVIHNVEIIVRGVLANIKNVTIHHNGVMWLNHGGCTKDNEIHTFVFDTVRVQDTAIIHGEMSPKSDAAITLRSRAMFIDGGGLLRAPRLVFETENITIDDGGALTADYLGYNTSHGYGGRGIYGIINEGHGKDSASGASGAGHGGSGGRGNINGGTPFTGFAYGDIYEPDKFGSAGGQGQGRGGNGGGVLWINATNVIEIDGTISVNGESGPTSGSGGGSGGSIWLYCKTIKGYGKISANGGDGSKAISSPGGGGAGGRIGIYFKVNKTSTSFVYESRGGSALGCMVGSTSQCKAEAGGPGTVFLYHIEENHRTLLLNNGGQKPLVAAINDYNDLGRDGCRAWILPQSVVHPFAKLQGNFHFEELQIYGGSHLAVLTEPVYKNASLHFLYMIGDRTGTVHITRNQVMDLNRAEIDVPFNAYVYADGYLGLAPYTEVHGVTIFLTGTLANIQNITLHHGGVLWINDQARTINNTNNTFVFDAVRVQDNGLLRAISSPIIHQGMFLSVRSLFVEGGGEFKCTRLTVLAENITVDDGGHIHSDGLGYDVSHIPKSIGLHGVVNQGIGTTSSHGSSGAGHGGRAGRGSSAVLVGNAYGDLYEPIRFGSCGGGSAAGAGGGVIWLNVTNTIRIDGEVTANGLQGGANSGGGSGGSIWIHSNTIKGTGNISVNGGAGGSSSGGGAGGRIALYFVRNTTYTGKFNSRGGAKGGARNTEAGGPGTSFLYHLVYTHRTLLIDNGGQHPLKHRINDYSDLSQDGCRAWILTESGTHWFANGTHNFFFEELQIYGGGHLAIDSGPANKSVTMFFTYMIGDRTGSIHIGKNQDMDLHRQFLDIPFTAYIYEGGYLGLAHVSELNGINIYVEGTLANIRNLTILNGGILHCFLTGSTANEPKRRYVFNETLRIMAYSKIETYIPNSHPEYYTLKAKILLVEGGSLVRSKHLHIHAVNMTVDDGGAINANYGGYRGTTGPGSVTMVPWRASGAGHGGTGGRAACDSSLNIDTCKIAKGMPYGNMFYPKEFGTGGNSADGGSGGGILNITIDTALQVDGEILVNALNVNSNSGGSSGGSILIQTQVFSGSHTGRIQALGGHGKAGSGGGSGGRIAVYYNNKVTHHPYRGKIEVYGGFAAQGGEPGSSGTVYLKHTDNKYSVLKIDNNGQKSFSDDIPNSGSRLNLAGGNLDRGLLYSAPNGVTVRTGCNLHSCSNCQACQPFSLAHLFDRTYSINPCHIYLSACKSAHLNFDLKTSIFINHIRLYPSCNYRTEFKVSKPDIIKI